MPTRLQDFVAVSRSLAWKHGITVAAMLLVAALCWLLAQWTWTFLAFAAPRSTPPGSSSPGGPVDGQAPSKVIASQLFGQVAREAPPAPAPVVVTPLNLKLKGVYAPLGPYPGFAVVNADGRDQPFQLGGEIMPGVELIAVQARHIVIRRQGALEQVELENRTSAAGGPALAVRTGLPPPQGQMRPGSLVAPAASSEFRLKVQATGHNTAAFSRGELNAALQDTTQLANLGRATLNPGGGLIIEEVPPGSLSEKLGLKQGDVVRQVNGQAVNSLADMARLYQELGQASQIKLQGVRSGSPLNLSFNVQP
jgi:general secretion pathway protein C